MADRSKDRDRNFGDWNDRDRDRDRDFDRYDAGRSDWDRGLDSGYRQSYERDRDEFGTGGRRSFGGGYEPGESRNRDYGRHDIEDEFSWYRGDRDRQAAWRNAGAGRERYASERGQESEWRSGGLGREYGGRQQGYESGSEPEYSSYGQGRSSGLDRGLNRPSGGSRNFESGTSRGFGRSESFGGGYGSLDQGYRGYEQGYGTGTEGWGGINQGYGARINQGYGTGMNRPLGMRGGGMDQDLESGMGRTTYRGRGPKGYRRSDERITEDINDRLTDDPHLDATNIEVKVSQGEVTLTGTVDSRHAKRRAEDIAEGCQGVIDVQNQIRVQHHDTETSLYSGRTEGSSRSESSQSHHMSGTSTEPSTGRTTEKKSSRS